MEHWGGGAEFERWEPLGADYDEWLSRVHVISSAMAAAERVALLERWHEDGGVTIIG